MPPASPVPGWSSGEVCTLTMATRRGMGRRTGSTVTCHPPLVVLLLPTSLVPARFPVWATRRSEQGREGRVGLGAEQHETHLADRDRHVRTDGLDRDPGRVVHRPSVDTGRDRRDGDARRAELLGDPQGLAVGRGQHRAAVLGGRPDRAYGVDDPPGGQLTGCGRDRLAGRQPAAEVSYAQGAALGEDLGTTTAVDRTVDAPTAEQRGVRRVDDGVDVLLGDVTVHGGDVHAPSIPRPPHRPTTGAQPASVTLMRSRRNPLPLLSILTTSRRPICRVDATCVPPSACVSRPTMSTIRTTSRSGGRRSVAVRIRSGCVAKAAALSIVLTSIARSAAISASHAAETRSRNPSGTSGRLKSIRASRGSMLPPVTSAPKSRNTTPESRCKPEWVRISAVRRSSSTAPRTA